MKKTIELHYENLSENTKLRFLELEINASFRTLATGIFKSEKYPIKKAQETIANVLVPDLDKKALREDLIHAFNNFRFRKPQKDEIIHYFRYKRIGVSKIIKYAKTSPNRVQAMKHDHPNYTPVYPNWLGFKGLVANWDNLKTTINFFEDDLIQGKDIHAVQLGQTQINEEEPEQIETKAVLPSDEPLEPVGVFEAQRLFPFDKDKAVDCMIQVYVAAYGHAEMDEPYRSDIYNGKHNLIELGVINYIQDPEDRKLLLKLYANEE